MANSTLPGLHSPPAIAIVDSSIGKRLREILGDTYRETVVFGGPGGVIYLDETCEITPEIFSIATALHARDLLDQAPVPTRNRHILSDWLA